MPTLLYRDLDARVELSWEYSSVSAGRGKRFYDKPNEASQTVVDMILLISKFEEVRIWN